MSDTEIIATLRRELEDYATSNHALRVELHVTQQNLLAQQSATASLARGAAFAKSEHLTDVANLRAELFAKRAQVSDLERVVQAQRETIGKLGGELGAR